MAAIQVSCLQADCFALECKAKTNPKKKERDVVSDIYLWICNYSKLNPKHREQMKS